MNWKNLKPLSDELGVLIKDVKENKQDGFHVLYNLDDFLFEKDYDYMEDDDIYIIFHDLEDAYHINDAYDMIDDLESSFYTQLDGVNDTMVDKLVRQSETLRDAYSRTQLGENPYLYFNTKDLRVEYVSTRRAYLFLQDFKKAILKLERKRETNPFLVYYG